MRHHRLVLALCTSLLASVTSAAAAPPKARHHRVVRPQRAAPASPSVIAERDAYRDADADADELAAPARVRVRVRKRKASRPRDWHVAVGPYLWAAAVDTSVSAGGASVGSTIDVGQIAQHARYGGEVLGEARYGRFSLAGDLTFGAVALTAERAVGPLMVSVDGTATSVLVDGLGGVRLYGSERSPLAFEARGGIRYMHTTVTATVGVAGGVIADPAIVFGGSDALAGARAIVRPLRRVALCGAADVGVFGASSRTWSASLDANVRITSRFLLSLGWRTLTLDRALADMTMHGPRAAIQVLF